MDARSARDSKAIEELGFYDPLETQEGKALQFKQERVKYWLSVGAQPSRTVCSLLKKVGIDPTPGKQVGGAAGWSK